MFYSFLYLVFLILTLLLFKFIREWRGDEAVEIKED